MICKRSKLDWSFSTLNQYFDTLTLAYLFASSYSFASKYNFANKNPFKGFCKKIGDKLQTGNSQFSCPGYCCTSGFG